MIQLFIKRSLVLAMFLSLFVACSSEITPVQAENSNTDTNDQTDAVADVIQLENGDFVVEGDMVFTPEQLVSSNVLKKGNAQSALFRVNNYEWGPNPTIEYYFVPANASKGNVSMSTHGKNEFIRALKDMSNGVALQFKEVTTPSQHTVYVYTFQGNILFEGCENGKGCSWVGKVSEAVGYKNEVAFSINKKGINYRTFFHEMMHTLGFVHEHQRENATDYVILPPKSDDMTQDDYDANYGAEYGDVLNTYFDMASIMLYSGFTPKNNVAAYQWLGLLPLPSSQDKAALKEKFGSETTTKNNYYIKNGTGKYLCRSTTGANASLRLTTRITDRCIWDITTGALNLRQTSQYSGIVLDKNTATTIRSTESTKYGGIYLSYQRSNNQFGLSVVGGGIQYASKWIPKSNGPRESVIIWNPLGYCLGESQSNANATLYLCSEKEIFTNPLIEWNLIPTWNTKVPY